MLSSDTVEVHLMKSRFIEFANSYLKLSMLDRIDPKMHIRRLLDPIKIHDFESPLFIQLNPHSSHEHIVDNVEFLIVSGE